MDVERTTYNVIEAKAAAESAHGVGKRYFLAVHQPGQRTLYISREDKEKLRVAARRAIAPPVSQKTLDRVSEALTDFYPKSAAISAQDQT
jgi:hypothetical protein